MSEGFRMDVSPDKVPVVGGVVGPTVPVLGMESRSILKSIQTEDSKLAQAHVLSRSDLHYFRARYNYYRLSLLRLPVDEREVLEPALGSFFEKISQIENQMGEPGRPTTPFLHSVSKTPEVPRPVVSSSPASAPPPAPIEASLPREGQSHRSDLCDDVIGQLQLVRLALTAEMSQEAKRVLIQGVDRVIRRLDEERSRR